MTASIVMALEGYRRELGCYPPPTGWAALDGTTSPFAPGEAAEADSLHRYLCSPLISPVTGKTIGPFLCINPGSGCSVATSQPSGPTRILVDPYGHPLRYDVVKDAQGNPSPCVWSVGPDGKEGPVPFSRVDTITDPRDEDNAARPRR